MTVKIKLGPTSRDFQIFSSAGEDITRGLSVVGIRMPKVAPGKDITVELTLSDVDIEFTLDERNIKAMFDTAQSLIERRRQREERSAIAIRDALQTELHEARQYSSALFNELEDLKAQEAKRRLQT